MVTRSAAAVPVAKVAQGDRQRSPLTPYTEQVNRKRTMTVMTAEQFSVTAKVIREVFTPEMILGMNQSEEGSEILRRIIRDDIEGAAETIVSALWVNL